MSGFIVGDRVNFRLLYCDTLQYDVYVPPFRMVILHSSSAQKNDAEDARNTFLRDQANLLTTTRLYIPHHIITHSVKSVLYNQEPSEMFMQLQVSDFISVFINITASIFSVFMSVVIYFSICVSIYLFQYLIQYLCQYLFISVFNSIFMSVILQSNIFQRTPLQVQRIITALDHTHTHARTLGRTPLDE